MTTLYEHLFGTVKKRMLISGVADLHPPCEFLAGSKQGRRHREVRPVAPAGSRLDRDVPIAAQVAVADPHTDIRRQSLIPANLNRVPRPPLQPCMSHRPAPQKHLATMPSPRPGHVTCPLNAH